MNDCDCEALRDRIAVLERTLSDMREGAKLIANADRRLTKPAGRQRHRVSNARLRHVADIVESGGGPAKVAAELRVSKSQAYRLLSMARERGMIG